MENIRLFVSIISNRPWEPEFGMAYGRFCVYLAQNGIKGHKLEAFNVGFLGQASCLSIAQEKLVDDMIEGGYTHWINLDDDMVFPADICDRLIVHDKDFVAANYRHKTNDFVKGVCDDMNGDMLDSTGKTGLQEVSHTGGAVFLARVASVKCVPKPRFAVPFIQETNGYMGSDVYFCAMMRQAGVHLYCDHDLSQDIGHIGKTEYRFPKKSEEVTVHADKNVTSINGKVQPITIEELHKKWVVSK